MSNMTSVTLDGDK